MLILEENFRWHLAAFVSELFIYIYIYIHIYTYNIYMISVKSLLLSISNLVRWPQFSPPQQRTDYISC